MTKQKRKNDQRNSSTFDHVVMLLFFAAITAFFAFGCFGVLNFITSWSSTCLMAPCFPDWDDMNAVADYYNWNIPWSAENVRYENNDNSEKLTFDIPPCDVQIVKDSSCNSEFYQSYDPTQNRHYYSSEHPTVIIKTHEFVFYSHSVDTPSSTISKLCPWNMSIQIDMFNKDRYYITYQRNEYIDCYGACYTTRRFVQPIEDSTFSVLGLTQNENENYYLEFDELCFDSKMYHIISPPSDHHVPEHTRINISIDDRVTLPTGIVTWQTRLVREYTPSNNGRNRLHSPHNEFCVKQDWDVGKHTVDVEMILPDETVEHYSFDFYVE